MLSRGQRPQNINQLTMPRTVAGHVSAGTPDLAINQSCPFLLLLTSPWAKTAKKNPKTKHVRAGHVANRPETQKYKSRKTVAGKTYKCTVILYDNHITKNQHFPLLMWKTVSECVSALVGDSYEFREEFGLLRKQKHIQQQFLAPLAFFYFWVFGLGPASTFFLLLFLSWISFPAWGQALI